MDRVRSVYFMNQSKHQFSFAWVVLTQTLTRILSRMGLYHKKNESYTNDVASLPLLSWRGNSGFMDINCTISVTSKLDILSPEVQKVRLFRFHKKNLRIAATRFRTLQCTFRDWIDLMLGLFNPGLLYLTFCSFHLWDDCQRWKQCRHLFKWSKMKR